MACETDAPDGAANRERVVKHFSLTRRIITAVVACQLLLTAALTLTAVLYARADLHRAFQASLQGRAMSTLAMVRYTETDPPKLVFDPTLLPAATGPERRDLFEIRGEDGSLIARTNGWDGPPPEVARTRRPYADFDHAGIPFRAIILRNIGVLDVEEASDAARARVTLIYAGSLGGLRERLAELAFSVAGTSLLLLLAASGLAAWFVRRDLAPLRELAAQAGAISVHHWDFDAPQGASLASELAPLVTAMETVLSRLRESFRRQREFTSDAAHELKTSVAIVKSTLQSLLQRPRNEQEYRAGLEHLLEDCARLEDLLERMLRLARIEQWADAGLPRKLATTELTSTCEAAISRIQAMADARNISVEMSHPASVHLRADPEDLELIWLNLLENAVQYSPAGSKVSLRVERNPARQLAGGGEGTAYVTVEDSGPGISEHELPHIFERFHRGDPSRARSTGGFGLGLAICKALVEAYGGSIEAQSALGRGSSFRVQLPVEPD